MNAVKAFVKHSPCMIKNLTSPLAAGLLDKVYSQRVIPHTPGLFSLVACSHFTPPPPLVRPSLPPCLHSGPPCLSCPVIRNTIPHHACPNLSPSSPPPPPLLPPVLTHSSHHQVHAGLNLRHREPHNPTAVPCALF